MILKPDYDVVSVFDIPFEQMKKDGIKAVLFDLDSTVMPSKSGEFPKEILDLFTKLQNDFCLAIISNNKNRDYIKKAGSQISFSIIGTANKPNPKILKKFLDSKGISYKSAVMIGDRPLTDILAGKLAGTQTVLVDSITKDLESFIVRFARKLERILCVRTF